MESVSASKPATMKPRLQYVLTAAVAIGTALALMGAVHRSRLPFQLDYAEGPVLHAAANLADGMPLYPPVQNLPLEIHAYPPYIYNVVALLVRPFGLGWFYPRMLSLSCALLVCALIACLAQFWTQSWLSPLTFGLLLLTIPVVHPWLSIIRFDFVGLSLAFLGMLIFARFSRYWYLSIVPFAIATSGLYTLVAAPAACFLYLLTTWNWKRAALFGASLGLALVSIFYFQYVHTHGWIGFHLFNTQRSPYSIGQLVQLSKLIWRTHGLLFVLAFSVFGLCFKQHNLRLPAIYLATASATSLTLGKIGAAENHMLQLLAVSCLCAGLSYDWMRRNVPHDFAFAILTLSLAFMIVANAPIRRTAGLDDFAECDKAYSAVKNDLGDRILGENVGALALAGKRVYVSDPFLYRWLADKAGFVDSDLRQLVSAGGFTAIVTADRVDQPDTPSDRWPAYIRTSIRENYTLSRQFACRDARYVYEPIARNK